MTAIINAIGILFIVFVFLWIFVYVPVRVCIDDLIANPPKFSRPVVNFKRVAIFTAAYVAFFVAAFAINGI